MSSIIFEAVVIFLLVLSNGIFAMSEMAIVSASKARLQQRADSGDTKARTALKLADSPNRFVTAVQIGMSLIGILTGAFGGATIAEKLAVVFSGTPAIAPYSEAISLAIVVLIITYISVVLGELVPKRLALIASESIATRIAKPMQFLSRIVAPAVHILTLSTEAVLRLFGIRNSSHAPMTEDELQVLIQQSVQEGTLETSEQKIVERAFQLDDQPINVLMTPRRRILWLNLDQPQQGLLAQINHSPYSRFPVCQGELDNVVGILKIKDLLTHCMTDSALGSEGTAIPSVLHPPLFVHESIAASETLERFKQSRMHLALVLDEYGVIQGLVTLNDILEALVGAIPPDNKEIKPQAIQGDDGAWIVDGMYPINQFKTLFDLDELPSDERSVYHSVAGFVITQLGRIPNLSDSFAWKDYQFEVTSMDNHRIDKVRVILNNVREKQ